MADYAHNYTDQQLEALEKRFQAVYRQAERETQDKLMKYLHRFKAKDDAKKKLLAEGKITEEEYKKWRYGQMMTGKRWKEMRDKLAQDYTNANQQAVEALNHRMPNVFAENANYATYDIEQAAGVDTSFTLYDQQTVDRLLRDNPELLPHPSVDIPADLRWNKQKIQSAIEQGVLQGESIPDIAKRLQKVTSMNQSAAVRNARTAMTSAQNGGRIESYHRAQNMGIKMKKCWVATMDNRVRHEHAALDGETAEVDKPFEIAGVKIMFPGDASAPGFMVWNCRCTVISQLKGFERDVSKDRFSRLGDMSYDKWKEYHKSFVNKGNTSTKQKEQPITIKDCIRREEMWKFTDGQSGVRKEAEAIIYELPNGTKFVFPKKYNKNQQTMTPEKAIELYGRVPKEIRDRAQGIIEFQDVYNPADKYWRQRYKNFTHSYATGGQNVITFWRYDHEHDEDYVVSTYCHEIGHKIDTDVGDGGRFSVLNDWTNAMENDKIATGMKSPTRYGENSPAEDFAESLAQYVTHPDEFKSKFKHRAKLIDDILKG